MAETSKLFSSISNTLPDTRRARNTFVISLGAVLLLAILLGVTALARQNINSILTLALGMVIFGLSAWLSRNNRHDLAAAINIFSLSAMILSRVFFQKGLAIQVGVIYFVLISAISIYTLPGKWIARAILFSFLLALLTIIIDQYTVGVPLSPAVGLTTGMAVLVGAIYLFILAIQFRNLSLRAKLVVSFLFLSITPLIILGWRTYITTGEISAASQALGAISGIIRDQTRADIVISVMISMFATIIAIIVSTYVTAPIIQLTRVAEKMSGGDFNQKAPINSKDEIGVLARTFNTMTDQIQELIGNLEKRVEQRTSDLEQRTEELEKIKDQIEKRARKLETIAEISRSISTEKDQEKLLQLITQAVSESFGFYHVGVFLLEENKKFAVLRAANSPGGQVMLRRQHKLEVGQTGIVGNVTFSGKPRVALDTGEDSVFFKNPDLPDTRSEMAVPLIARGEIIGALDVQSTQPKAFVDEDVSIISLLADQVSIAIDNVRLLEEAKNSLAESQSLFTEYLANAWQKKSNSTILGYLQTLTGGKIITTGTPEASSPLNVEEKPSLSVPIQVRDQVIGILNIKPASEGRIWNKDEMNIVEAVAERLGLALDNARLFEETSSRASRERLVSDITTKIRGTNDPQEMVRTAVEELQRALGASRIEIVPQKSAPPPDR
ncbi:MAG: GAF domain-containing protein [Chloroflexi bacterium]|nr:GAF domain-containing protein [Chloroflexota bacterium]